MRSSIISAPSSQVGSSLYATAKDNKVPDYIIAELTRVFAYDVDFQRQVKASDSFEVFYGNPLTGSSTKRKVLHYAQLTLGGKTKTYYRFTTADGQTDYYDEKGRSATKSLLKTPVSRRQADFGLRHAPPSAARLFEDAYRRRLRRAVWNADPRRRCRHRRTRRPPRRLWHRRRDPAQRQIRNALRPYEQARRRHPRAAPRSTRARSSAMSARPAARPAPIFITKSASTTARSTRPASRRRAASNSPARIWPSFKQTQDARSRHDAKRPVGHPGRPGRSVITS